MTRTASLTIRMLGESDARVVAMAIDTDGCVGILSHHDKRNHGSLSYTPHIEFANTTRELVEFVKDIIDCDVTVGDREVQGHNCKRGYYVCWGSLDDVYSILIQIEPYLIRKREVARVVMDFCELRLTKLEKNYHAPYGEEERMLYERAKELNKKGREVHELPEILVEERLSRR